MLGCPSTALGWRLVIKMFVEKQALGRRRSAGVIKEEGPSRTA